MCATEPEPIDPLRCDLYVSYAQLGFRDGGAPEALRVILGV